MEPEPEPTYFRHDDPSLLAEVAKGAIATAGALVREYDRGKGGVLEMRGDLIELGKPILVAQVEMLVQKKRISGFRSTLSIIEYSTIADSVGSALDQDEDVIRDRD